MNQNELQSLIENARQGGINMKKLYEASGLRWYDFAIAHRNMTFTPYQRVKIVVEVNKWKQEIKTTL